MKNYIWQLNKTPDIRLVEKLSQGLSFNPLIIELLVSRGISTVQDALNFFSPNTSQLHSPLLMKDMEKAVSRIVTAITMKQKVLVYGDYDVDGTTAVAMMYSFLKKMNTNVIYYIPDRYKEGYGVSMKGMRYALKESCDVIITLDCGIKANETIEFVQSQGIDVIICDHHEPGEFLPKAYAVLDPKRKDCEYPFKELSGCGVGFKLIQALCNEFQLNEKENLYCYLDILAISIASDIVPIVNENRIYMYYGLIKMKINPHLGIRIMLQNAMVGDEITVSDVVFKIGPRINAAGRIDDAKNSVELLLAENDENAQIICSKIQDFNIERRELDKKITQEALEIIANDADFENQSVNVVYKPKWKKGVIGIVASRIIETYYKPTIVFCGEGDILSGSARSVHDFDLYEALEQCSDLLENFGGHKYAAGMTIHKSNYEKFKEKFNSVVFQLISQEMLIPKIFIDKELHIENISLQLFDEIQRFAPFGPQNMTPVFMIRKVIDSGKTKIVGNDKSHVKFSISTESNNDIMIDGIGFGLAKKWKDISSQSKYFDVCFVVKDNIFNNNRKVQLEIRDIRISEL